LISQLFGAGLEVAALVEDVVGREKRFEMSAGDFSVAQNGDGVVERSADGFSFRSTYPTIASIPWTLLAMSFSGAQVVVDELLLEQQVFRGIADDRKLGEDDKLRAAGPGAVNEVQDLRAVATKVADGRVDLCERDAHGHILGGMSARRSAQS
jgi:hypothetical protein